MRNVSKELSLKQYKVNVQDLGCFASFQIVKKCPDIDEAGFGSAYDMPAVNIFGL